MRPVLATLLAVLAAACAVCVARTAHAADPDAGRPRTPEQVIEHHFAAIAARNLDSLADDYADDAVLITAAGVIRGKAAIRAQFARLLRLRRPIPVAGEATAPRASGIAQRAPAGPQFLQRRFTSSVAWLIWVRNAGRRNEVRGVETYLVRGGKITVETVGTVNVHRAAP